MHSITRRVEKTDENIMSRNKLQIAKNTYVRWTLKRNLWYSYECKIRKKDEEIL